jgi:acyl-CoA-binding protein
VPAADGPAITAERPSEAAPTSAGRVVRPTARGARYASRVSLTEEFAQAQADVKTLAQRPANDVLLKLYALYKQGAAGDVSGNRPGMLDLVGRAKYDAWETLEGTSQEDAQSQYVALVQELLAGTA